VAIATKIVTDWWGQWWERFVTTILSRHEERITNLEEKMSELTDKLDAIDQASSTEAAAVQQIADEVAALRDQINSGTLPDDAAARLDNIATALTSRAQFLTDLAADPNNPVPPAPEPLPEPTPEPAPESGA
jgi:methyl-accepting chemotaxis protein